VDRALVEVHRCERCFRCPKKFGREHSVGELRLCFAAHHFRIPRSVFLGRVVAEGEPLWLDDDRESALAYIEYLDSLCGGCGNPAAESMDEANDGKYEAVPVHCFACAARDAENRAASKARSSDSMSDSSFDGLLIGIKKIED